MAEVRKKEKVKKYNIDEMAVKKNKKEEPKKEVKKEKNTKKVVKKKNKEEYDCLGVGDSGVCCVFDET